MKNIIRAILMPPLIATQLIVLWPTLVYLAFVQFGAMSGLAEIALIPLAALKLIAVWPYSVVVAIVDWIEP